MKYLQNLIQQVATSEIFNILKNIGRVFLFQTGKNKFNAKIPVWAFIG